MVNTQFGAILKEFEPFFNCPLVPDENDSCLIKTKSGLSIQIEQDRYGLLLIGCRLGALPMSRYRDNLIQQALKSNDSSLPFTGTFGFSLKSNQLILFIRLNPANFAINQLQKIMVAFIIKAKQWTEAIAKNEMPTVNKSASSSSASGLFGLMPK